MEDPNYRGYLGLVIKALIVSGNDQTATAQRLILGPTPQVLIDIGMPAVDLVITGGVIGKCMFEHGVVKSRMERLYEIISKPKAIYSAENPKQPNTVVLTYETKNGAPIIVPIEPNHQVARSGCVNRIASVYEKTVGVNGPPIEVRWKGLLLWEDSLVTATIIPITGTGP